MPTTRARTLSEKLCCVRPVARGPLQGIEVLRDSTATVCLGIDQHARKITMSLRDETGDVLQARQVSTQPERVKALFQQLTGERLHDGGSFVAVPEVCGFNDWLIRMLYRLVRALGDAGGPRRPCAVGGIAILGSRPAQALS
jgi:hypothetical protein